MRIGIDARFFGSVGKGLGRYTRKLIESIEKLDHVNSYFIFLRKENWPEYQPQKNNFTKVLADIPWYSLREQIQMPKILKKYGLDLVHFPHFNVPTFYGGKFVVTIHDLILFRYPTKRATTLSPLTYFFKKRAHRKVIRHAIEKSEKIITVSNHTKSDILKYFNISHEKIIVTHEGVDGSDQPALTPPAEILKKYGIIKPYILYVGNAYPHKNLERLILAFRELVKKFPRLRLVLVGKDDYFYKRVKKFVEDKSPGTVIFTGFVLEEDLPTVYREARVYVFPSLYEGFGLPPLEAMAKNIPVASSNSSCLPEILGEAAHFFDPRGVSGITEAMERVLTDEELRKKLISAGRERIKMFSWEKMARETLEIYESTFYPVIASVAKQSRN